MQADEMKALEAAIEEITEIAEGFGLDFFPMRYEICPAEVIYTFGAYGMPIRFSHWSFGKQFHKMKLQYDLGLSKIYELVINSDPCYAFLLNTNSLVQNKMIVAHVLAHSDFFKNNIRFSNTRRDMVESMSATAERIAHYEIEYGKERVEKFIDAVLAIQEHIDPSLIKKDNTDIDEKAPQKAQKSVKSPYDDLLKLDNLSQKEEPKQLDTIFPAIPQKDLLNFIEQHSRILTDWQRDILTMLREEMLYFWPQLETKIMNEGWASYWHARIMRELDLDTGETVEFAKLNANVVQPSRQSLNPYYLGLKLLEDIEERYNNPTEEMIRYGVKPGSGREKLFEVRALEWDQTFLRNYLTKEFAEKEDLFIYEREGRDVKITSKEFKDIRDELVSMRINGGYPYIVVENGDYMKNGELYLKHNYEGTELDIKYLEKVMPYIHQLWGRTVHMETVVENHPVVFTSDGEKISRRRLD